MATRAQQRAELLTKAATYRDTAVQVHDPELTAAYLRMAQTAEQDAEALRPRMSRTRVTRGTWRGTNGTGH